MKRGRPYPPDKERRVRIKTELARRDMTVSDLARVLGIKRPAISNVINGTRISKKTEEKIAAYFGTTRQELFRPRGRTEIDAARRALAGKGGAA
jgi:plasmid maintenance system antidote protein VapI